MRQREPQTKMKIKLKTSQSTKLSNRTIIDRIISELNNSNYRILNTTNDIVEFDDSPWKLMWNFQAARRFDGGKFEISLRDNLTLVSFTYYRSLIWPVIILIVLSIILIAQGEYHAPLFFLAFYIFAIGINMITLKGIAEDMLTEIIEGPSPD